MTKIKPIAPIRRRRYHRNGAIRWARVDRAHDLPVGGKGRRLGIRTPSVDANLHHRPSPRPTAHYGTHRRRRRIATASSLDRQRVVEGKMETVRGEAGGRRVN